MKTIGKNIMAIGLLVWVGFHTSCSGGGDAANGGEKDSTQNSEAHQHIFACPMHPEITGHEGEKCSKCGMPLEHNDGAEAKGNFQMEFSSSPLEVQAKKPVTLSFKPQNLDDKTVAVPLETRHEKKIHLIVVSDDLSWFDHIHPEYQSDGSYKVEETFPAAGEYLLYADYKPNGAAQQLEQVKLIVDGKEPAAKVYSNESLVYNSADGITVRLDLLGAKLAQGTGVHMNAVITDKGKPVDANTLENYLGAKAHSVMIPVADKTYQHVHPEVEDGNLHFHLSFETSGIYRAWVQFVYKGKLYTADFTLKVADAAPGETDAHPHSHSDEKEHTH